MGDSVGLVANQVVEAVRAVGVDEAVSNPFTSSDAEEVSIWLFGT
jgi:hypothetical protein